MYECLEIYSYSGSLQTGPEFMLELGIDFYDIAYYDGKWWYACNDTQYPVRIYDGNGSLVGYIGSSVLPAAHGMTFDDSGYLWVSNMDTDQIYKVDVDVTPLTRSTWGAIKTNF